jgi:hypothetical protein
MPFTPATQLGPLATLLPRSAEAAMEAAGIQSVVGTDTGIVSRSAISGDALAAVREAMGTLLEHLLAETSDPRISTFLIVKRDEIGL